MQGGSRLPQTAEPGFAGALSALLFGEHGEGWQIHPLVINQVNLLELLERSWAGQGKQLQNLLVALKVRQSFLSKRHVILQTSKASGILKYGNCLLALAPCSLGGKSQGSSMCPAHFQREKEHFEKTDLGDAVGSFALRCSWENMT